jgi:hypothetical protein
VGRGCHDHAGASGGGVRPLPLPTPLVERDLPRRTPSVDVARVWSGPSWLKDASQWLCVKLRSKGGDRTWPDAPRGLKPTVADIIDMLTMHPEARRRVVRVLGEIVAFW